MNKKIFSLLICIVLLLVCLVGCGKKKAEKDNASSNNQSNNSSNESSGIDYGDGTISIPEGFDPEKLPYYGDPIELPDVEV